jgi:transcriptional regulator with XRE-family HTH domain
MAKKQARDEGEETLDGLIQRRVRALRQERGWSQDDLGWQVRAFGLPWDRDVVKRVEGGQRPVSLPELLVLLERFRVDLAAFLGDEQRAVAVAPGWAFTEPSGVLDVLAGRPMVESFQGDEERFLKLDRDAAAARLVESRAARRLGLSVADLGQLARRLWRKRYQGEQERRLTERLEVRDGDPQRVRGRITREMDAEIRAALERRKGGKR